MVEYFLESPSGLGMWLVELLPTVNEGLGSIPRSRGNKGERHLASSCCSLRSTRRLHCLASQAVMKAEERAGNCESLRSGWNAHLCLLSPSDLGHIGQLHGSILLPPSPKTHIFFQNTVLALKKKK